MIGGSFASWSESPSEVWFLTHRNWDQAKFLKTKTLRI